MFSLPTKSCKCRNLELVITYVLKNRINESCNIHEDSVGKKKGEIFLLIRGSVQWIMDLAWVFNDCFGLK